MLPWGWQRQACTTGRRRARWWSGWSGLPAECRRLLAELDTLTQRIEANRETGEPVEELERQLSQLSLELTAAEVDWLERQARGTLRQVFPDDVRAELESITGTSDYPDLHVPTNVPGGARSAGSGNLRS